MEEALVTTLSESLSGNNELIAKSYETIERLKENLPELTGALLDILFHYSNETVRTQAGYFLHSLLTLNWDNFTDEHKQQLLAIIEEHIQGSDACISVPFASVASFIGDRMGSDIIKTVITMKTTDDDSTAFRSAFLWSQTDNTNMEVLVQNIDSIRQSLLEGLLHPLWSVRFFALNSIAQYIECFPYEVSALKEHAKVSLKYAIDSVNLSESLFELFWIHVSEIYSTHAGDWSAIFEYVPIILAAAQCKKFSAEVRFIPLRCCISYFEDFSDDICVQILKTAYEIAVDYTQQTRSLPTNLLVFQKLAIKRLDLEHIYPILRSYSHDLLNSDEWAKTVTVLASVSDVVNLIPHMFSTTKIIDVISEKLKTGDQLTQRAACQIICALDGSFNWEIVPCKFIFEQIVSLFSSDSFDLRYDAMFAVSKVLRHSPIPIPHAVETVMSQLSSIHQNSIILFAQLVTIAIENTCTEPPYIPLAHLAASMMNDQHIEVKAAGIIIGQKVLTHLPDNQADYQNGIATTLDALVTTVNTEHSFTFLLRILSHMSLVFPDCALSLLQKFQQPILSLTDSENTAFRSNSIICLAKISMRLSTHPLFDDLKSILFSLAQSPESYEKLIAVKGLAIFSPSGEFLSEMAQIICSIKDSATVSKAVRSFVKVLKKSPNKQSGCQLVQQYIEGLMEFEDNVPPSMTDIDYPTFFVFQLLMRELLLSPNEATGMILDFEKVMYERDHSLIKARIIRTWAYAIIYGIVTDYGPFIQELGKMLKENVPIESITGTTSLALCLYMSGGATDEQMIALMPLLGKVWRNCLKMKLIPSAMKLSLTFIRVGSLGIGYPLGTESLPEDLNTVAELVLWDQTRWRGLSPVFYNEYILAPARIFLAHPETISLIKPENVERIKGLLKERIENPETKPVIHQWLKIGNNAERLSQVFPQYVEQALAD